LRAEEVAEEMAEEMAEEVAEEVVEEVGDLTICSPAMFPSAPRSMIASLTST
jgi:hypothetical protein